MLRPETPAQSAFRAEVRAWLEANLPKDLRHLSMRPPPEAIMPWYRTFAQKDWIAPHWPKEYGGMEASPVEQLILVEELARIGAPDLPVQGFNHIGPTLMKYGTDDQKRQHLPKIRKGETIWSQGYTEPGAGSDLASLRTKGVIEGSEIIINGHKIWTTWGHHADWMFALVRTGEGRSRRDGISFVLIDLKSPGITRRPILNIAQDDEFCEVFLDNVRAPLSNLVGKPGGGWAIAMGLLDEERIRSSSPSLALRALSRLKNAIRLYGLEKDALAQDALARAEIEVAALSASFLDAFERFGQGPIAGQDSSYLKILSTEATQTILGLLQELVGADRALRHPRQWDGARIDFSELYLQSRRLTIYGGSNEIQRTLLATRTLALPMGEG